MLTLAESASFRPLVVHNPIHEELHDSRRRFTRHPRARNTGLTCRATVARSVRATSGRYDPSNTSMDHTQQYSGSDKFRTTAV